MTRMHAIVGGLGLFLGAAGALMPGTEARAEVGAEEVASDPVSHVPGRVIVRFKPRPADQPVEAWFDVPNAKSIRRLVPSSVKRPDDPSKDGAHQLHLVELDDGVDARVHAAQLRALPQVAYAEPDYIVRVADTAPNDPEYAQCWGLANTGQTGGLAGADIDAPAAWDITTGSASVVVAVLDTGVDWLHPDLADNMWVNPGESGGGMETDGVDNDGNGYIDDVYGYDFLLDDPAPDDAFGHGTHVAGTIAAVGDNGLGVAGVAWSAEIMALRFLGASGSGSTSAAVEALYYAIDNGARITNNSWGGGGYSQSLRDALVAARDAGVLFVASAGNAASDNDENTFYPAAYDVENVIAVASTDHDDNLSSFSNYGAESVALGAPGSDVLSTVPPYQTLFTEDFETALPPAAGPQFTLTGPANFWGTVDTGGNIVARGDASQSNPYQAGSDGWLVSPAFDTTGLAGLSLAFDYRYETELTDDALLVEAWDGSAWVEVFRRSSSNNLQSYFYSVRLDLEPHRNAALQVRFGWQTDGDDNDYFGVEIDRVEIRFIGSNYTTATAYGLKSGTSMAAPHVAGVAALLLADAPSACLQELRQRLAWTGDPIPALDGLTITGRRLNAFAALTAPAGLDVMAPNGGETWVAGGTRVVAWSSLACDPVDVYLLEGGAVHTQLADDVLVTGVLSWDLPDDLTPGTDYRIRVDDGTGLDESDADFTIVGPTIHHVDTSAAGANDGTSWADAFVELTDALAVALPDQKVWVAAGSYRPDYDTVGGIHTGDREASFVLIDDVEVYGGFPAGGGDGTFGARDPDAFTTMLTGDLNGDDAPDFTGYEENSRHVVRAAGTNRTALLDGFTVAHGHADGAAFPDNSGGGLLAEAGGPTLARCVFVENKAGHYGGAVLFNLGGARPALVACDFRGNDALVGGGIFGQFIDPVFVDCEFTDNNAVSGGALALHETDALLANCLFVANTGKYGGAVNLVLNSVLDTRNCTFAGNSSINGGGGGAVYANSTSTAVLANSILWGNTTYWGGTTELNQVRILDGTPTINHTCLEGWSGTWGGAANTGADPMFVDPFGPDAVAYTVDDDLRLAAGSPCVDTGDEGMLPDDEFDRDADADLIEKLPLDLDGGDRIGDGDEDTLAVVDMGAYERPGPTTPCPADTNGDTFVDVQDLLGVLGAWGTADPVYDVAPPGGDGAVDVQDLLAVLAAWGGC